MVEHGGSLRRLHLEPDLINALERDYRQASLDPPEQALLAFAEALTRTPGSITETDLEPLREVGLSDRAILDAVHVTGYFNFVNRVALGLGVELDPDEG